MMYNQQSFALFRETVQNFALVLDSAYEVKSANESLQELRRVLSPLQFAVVMQRKSCTGNNEKYVVLGGAANPTKCVRMVDQATQLSARPLKYDDVEIFHDQPAQYYGFAKMIDDFNVRPFNDASMQAQTYRLKCPSRRRRDAAAASTAFFHGERRVFIPGVTPIDEALAAAHVNTTPLVPFFQMTQTIPSDYAHTAPRIGEIVCGVIGEVPTGDRRREFLCWTPVSPQFVRLVQLLRYGPSHPTFRHLAHDTAAILYSLVFSSQECVPATYEHTAHVASPFSYALIALPLVFHRKLSEPLLWRSPHVHLNQIELQTFYVNFVSYITVLERAMSGHQPSTGGAFTIIVPTNIASNAVSTDVAPASSDDGYTVSSGEDMDTNP